MAETREQFERESASSSAEIDSLRAQLLATNEESASRAASVERLEAECAQLTLQIESLNQRYSFACFLLALSLCLDRCSLQFDVVVVVNSLIESQANVAHKGDEYAELSARLAQSEATASAELAALRQRLEVTCGESAQRAERIELLDARCIDLNSRMEQANARLATTETTTTTKKKHFYLLHCYILFWMCELKFGRGARPHRGQVRRALAGAVDGASVRGRHCRRDRHIARSPRRRLAALGRAGRTRSTLGLSAREQQPAVCFSILFLHFC